MNLCPVGKIKENIKEISTWAQWPDGQLLLRNCSLARSLTASRCSRTFYLLFFLFSVSHTGPKFFFFYIRPSMWETKRKRKKSACAVPQLVATQSLSLCIFMKVATLWESRKRALRANPSIVWAAINKNKERRDSGGSLHEGLMHEVLQRYVWDSDRSQERRNYGPVPDISLRKAVSAPRLLHLAHSYLS